MRYVLLSDVHANLRALSAVLADVATRAPDAAVYHLGDLVGYGPWPNEVVDLIRANGMAGVAGNYDSTVAHAFRHCGCRSENPVQEALAHRSFEWTCAHTSAASKSWLGGLPFRLDLRPLGGHVAGPTVALVHAAPMSNLVYVTDDRPDAFLTKLAEQARLAPGDVLCFGHTHKPWHRVVGGVHFVNTGSVGRPKDGDWRAGYVLLEVDESGVTVKFMRVEYDVEAAARGVVEAGLPAEFADFLRTGGRQGADPVATG
jgi:predicted phosphodiesterase